jgi:hypothetical protein
MPKKNYIIFHFIITVITHIYLTQQRENELIIEKKLNGKFHSIKPFS